MRRHMAIVAFMVVIIFTGILFAGLEGVSAKDYPYRVTRCMMVILLRQQTATFFFVSE